MNMFRHLISTSGLLRGLVTALAVSFGAGGVSVAAAAPAPVAAATNRPSAPVADYRLGTGDVLHIIVYQNPDLTLDARLSDSGFISFPLLGALKVGGLTVGETEALIANGLKKGDFVKNPQVTVVITQVRGSQVSVLGQVNRPGRYPLEQAQTRLSDVLALAGGITTATGSDLVTVVGTRDGKPMRLEVDLPRVFAAHNTQADFLLQNNDVVWVDRAPIVYIYGEVQRPGPMRVERGMTVMQALASGGGLTQRGTERGITIHRRNDQTGNIEETKPTMDSAVRDGDVIYVRESLF
jgi:polysaccharide export outer membrane protein